MPKSALAPDPILQKAKNHLPASAAEGYLVGLSPALRVTVRDHGGNLQIERHATVGNRTIPAVPRLWSMTNNHAVSGRVNIMKQCAIYKRAVSAISGGLLSGDHV